VPQAQFTAGTSGRMPQLLLLQSFLILFAKMFGFITSELFSEFKQVAAL
jgi:hypothetical protein